MIKIRLVDGNSVGRAAHSATKLKTGSLETQAIFGMIKASRNWLMQTPDFVPMVLWDGRAQWRYDLYPEYKSKRNDTAQKIAESEAYNAQKPHIMRALSALGIRQFISDDDEADDLAGHFVSLFKHKDPASEIILTTGDVDWAQLVREGVSWEDHRDHSKRINIHNIFEQTGFKTPLALLEGKCLKGDSSDAISGVGGIGEKGAPEFLAEHRSVREFLEGVRSGKIKPRSKALQRLASEEGRAMFMRNLKLMQLIKPRKIEHIQTIPAKFDREAFLDICGEFTMMSLIRDADNFLRPFEQASKR